MYITLTHESGIVRQFKMGFSWTILIFGGFPFLFRGMLIHGLLLLAVYWVWLPQIILAFIGNKLTIKYYLEKGYKLSPNTDETTKTKFLNYIN